MVDDNEFTDGEAITVGIIGFSALAIIFGVLIFSQFDVSFSIPDWGILEWTSVLLVVLIIGAVALAIYWGSDDVGDDDVFEGGYGFPLTVVALILGVIALQTNVFGLVQDPDEIRYYGSLQVPENYVLYDEPQPYGYGNYGPPADGFLTDGEGALAGAAVGCAGGAATFALVSWIPVVGWTAVAGGCAAGALAGGAAGYGLSSADFDGDPTTGW